METIKSWLASWKEAFILSEAELALMVERLHAAQEA